MKNPKKNCPYCQSEKVAPIPQKTIARIFGHVVPRKPYLCLDCRKRFGRFENPLQTLSAKIMAGAAVVVVLLFVAAVLLPKAPQPTIGDTAAPMRIPPAMQPESKTLQIPKMTSAETPELSTNEGMEGNSPERMPDQEPPAPTDQPAPAAELPEAKAVTEIMTAAPPMVTMADQAPPQQPIPLQTEEPPQQPPPGANRAETAATGNMALQARKLKFVNVRNSEETSTIHIVADGPIDAYHSFILTNPPRLVVDLAGKWEKPKFYGMKVENDLIKMVRLWKYEKKLRVVSDLKSDRKLEPAFETASDGLVVKLGRTAP